VLKLPTRQVDTHRQRLGARILVLPDPGLLAGLLQHEAPDRNYQPRLLRYRNERQRLHQPAKRMLPADKRLHPDDTPVHQRHNRLRVHAELSNTATEWSLSSQHLQPRAVKAPPGGRADTG
jgi:hypothetical protein